MKKKPTTGITANLTLLDEQFGIFWMGMVTIGTPGQKFYVNFDTGSTDLWIPGATCGDSCGGTNTFNSDASATHKPWNKDFFIQYGDGSYVSGVFANDTITVGNVSIASHPFAVINSAYGMDSSENDGVLGMAYQDAARGGESSVVFSMYLAGQIALPIFSFWFDAVSDGSDTGELVLGNYDTTKYTGCVTFVPVVGHYYWEFVTDNVSLSVGSTTTVIASSIHAMLDTGTTVAILGPPTYIDMIYKALDVTFDPFYGAIVDCQTKPLSAFPNITFTIGGVPFTLTPLMYLVISAADDSDNPSYICQPYIFAQTVSSPTSSSVWVLGDYFMKRFFNIFDMQNNRIGLAHSISYSIFPPVPDTLFPSV